MLKGMYGCIQASALWYGLIKKFLEDQGYQVSAMDRKRNGGRIYVLLLYVDDKLANVHDEEAEKLKQNLSKRFGTVQFEVTGRLSYLRMQIDILKQRTVIDMTFYVKQVLEGVDVPVRASPGTKLTFMVGESAKSLSEGDCKEFHSKVAKLLFLSNTSKAGHTHFCELSKCKGVRFNYRGSGQAEQSTGIPERYAGKISSTAQSSE